MKRYLYFFEFIRFLGSVGSYAMSLYSSPAKFNGAHWIAYTT